MVKLGVNIDHSATLRQARYRRMSGNPRLIVEPSPIKVALLAERGGADSITAHLREDRRHIQDSDIVELRRKIKTKFNMEMACNDDIINVALDVVPDYVCLVPENRMEITTEGGLDLAHNRDKVASTVERLSKKNIVCSVFIDPDEEQIDLAKSIGAPVVELHTGAYANAWGIPEEEKFQLERISAAARRARESGIVVNAGHGINYDNIRGLSSVADFNELNIGHTILSKSILVGIEEAVRQMKALLKKFPAIS